MSTGYRATKVQHHLFDDTYAKLLAKSGLKKKPECKNLSKFVSMPNGYDKMGRNFRIKKDKI